MSLAELRQRLRAAGALPVHEARVLQRWVRALPQEGGRQRPEDFLPKALRDALPALQADLAALAQVVSEHPADDGSARLLVGLHDGQAVEAVRLPPERAQRSGKPRAAGLCVSTQIGCAVGCRFCMTGVGGLVRQLGSAEIVAQVVLARRAAPVDKVVFMGMGEPAHNLDAVMEAIEFLGTAGGIGHKNLVLSSVGDERLFQRLAALPAGAVKPALALSLHSTLDARRAELLPRAPAFAPAALVEAGLAWARASGHPLQLQWTLLEGVNDGDDEVEGLVRLLAHRGAVLNLIPFNAGDGLDFRRPEGERAAALARTLHRRGILTKLRRSAGQDVDAGCGQLRARAASPRRRIVPVHVLAAKAAHDGGPGTG
ncbi:MAG: RNA methyltransferase [Rubrivivax sp.]|nr:RNA methyltransferase [Rubrivivax sp.]